MPEWTAFAGLSAVLTGLLLSLARLSQSYVTDPPELPPADPPVDEAFDPEYDDCPEARPGGDPGPDPPGGDPGPAGDDSRFGDDDPVPGPDDGGRGPVRDQGATAPVGADAGSGVVEERPDAGPGPAGERTAAGPGTVEERPDAGPGPGPAGRGRRPVDRHARAPSGSMSPGALVANVAFSQGLFGFLLVVGVWLFAIPPSALGLAAPSTGALALGLGFGVALYAVNEAGAVLAERLGLDPSERLREMLAPESLRGWILLLGVALPLVAGVEELLFRAALVGAVATGFGVSPWPLAVVSSAAFGLAHGAQGRGGALVAGALGLVLAAAFVVTNSFLVVFLAHYVVNALEFVVHEGLGIEWAE